MIQICDLDYIPQRGFPALDGQDGDERIVVEWLEKNPILPDYYTAFSDERFPVFAPFFSLILRKRSCVPVSEDLFRIRCEYDNSGDDGTGYTMGGGVYTICTCTNEAVDVPLAQHANYRTKWNHDMHAADGASSSTWMDDAKTTEVEESLASEYAWAKPGTVPADGWRVVMSAAKPGVESFLAFLPVVHVIRTGQKARLTRTMALDGTIQTPPDTFGCTALKWLQVGSSLVQQGRLWELTTDYRGSAAIDTDLYD